MSYAKQTADDGTIEYTEDGEVIAFINESGKLQAAHGKAKQKPGLEQWREETGDGSDEDATEGVITDPDTQEPMTEHDKEVLKNTIEDQTTERAPEQPKAPAIGKTVCPIEGASHLGDKDPAVIEWWRANHPEEFKRRYAHRRIQAASGIIV